MHEHSELLKRVCLGAAGGVVGTLALHALMSASKKLLPDAEPPMQDPGEFMVNKAERVLPSGIRHRIPMAAESAAAQGLSFGYGATFGALYAAMCPNGGTALLSGAVLGIGTWAVGYLGWLRALGLMPPVSEQSTPQIAGPIAEHVAYGVVTTAAYDWLRDQFPPAIPAEKEFGRRSAASAVGASA